MIEEELEALEEAIYDLQEHLEKIGDKMDSLRKKANKEKDD